MLRLSISKVTKGSEQRAEQIRPRLESTLLPSWFQSPGSQERPVVSGV